MTEPELDPEKLKEWLQQQVEHVVQLRRNTQMEEHLHYLDGKITPYREVLRWLNEATEF